MATQYLRLYDPTQQIQTKNGAINVAGRVYVYWEGTDDLAPLYDEDGSQLSNPVVLDDNGRAPGLFVDAAGVYWIRVCDAYDSELFTIEKMSPCGGGSGSLLGQTYEVMSSDGTVAVDRSVDGHTVTFDLSTNSGAPSVLKTHSNVRTTDGHFVMADPQVSGGRLSVVDGTIKANKGWYHYTANVELRCDQPTNISEPVRVYGPDDSAGVNFDMTFEHSFTLSVSGVVRANYDGKPLNFRVEGLTGGLYCNISTVSVHAIASVVNVGGGGGGTQVQSDWTCSDVNDPAYILHKPEQMQLIPGNNITFTESAQGLTISAAGGSSVVIGYVDL